MSTVHKILPYAGGVAGVAGMGYVAYNWLLATKAITATGTAFTAAALAVDPVLTGLVLFSEFYGIYRSTLGKDNQTDLLKIAAAALAIILIPGPVLLLALGAGGWHIGRDITKFIGRMVSPNNFNP